MWQNNRLELLAPAGDPEKLASALHFGADAVYLAGESFGLRKASKNFDAEQLRQAVVQCHAAGAKLYVTMNIIPHDADLDELGEYVRFLESAQVDAVIVSDPGIFEMVATETNLEIHLSTQASVTNARTVSFWARQGAKRIVLARELSLDEIRQIRQEVDPSVELEVFVHGAMCISVSGRCLLSNYMTGRDANRGDCAQACRWNYALMEEKRPGEYFPVYEEDGHTFIMNSKDLCLLHELPQLMEAGVSSLKIEGRVKSAYYVGTVVHAYRRALDAIQSGTWTEKLQETLLRELRTTSHRPFTTGFFYGAPGAEGQNYTSSSYLRDYDFLGIVRRFDPNASAMEVEVRNRFAEGEEIEVLRSDGEPLRMKIRGLSNAEGQPLGQAVQAKELVWMHAEAPSLPGDMLRRKRN